MPDVPESFWDNLLDYIQEGTVVPVIGSELVTVRDGEQDVPLDCWLARRLAKDLGLATEELPAGFALNEVVALHLRNRGEREELYPQIHRMLNKATLTPPEPLKALASIPGFNLFVSLTFDSLLADALGTPQQIAYSPNTVRDLPCPKAELRQPVVFHLLGKASASPDYAICDEDLLEFLHGLQDKQRQPKTLFDELRGNHLLFLGCSFGDWLARFFLRTARSLELSQKRRRWDVLVGDCIAKDAGLVLFLKSFSSDARVVPLTAADFATELARRWHAAHPPAAVAEPKSGEVETVGKTVPSGAIFISYASDDLEAASRLAEGLRAAGLEVWFDKNALQIGDDWARSIRRGIERCSLFLPVISQRSLSEENRRRYFWREWNDADDFARGIAPGEAFIVPIVIDDGIRIDRVSLPGSFQKAQGTSLPSGTVTPDVADRLKELVRDFHRRQRAA
jgi:TIR domain-containing protein/SIR2-like protein